jgi:hypothetical protein
MVALLGTTNLIENVPRMALPSQTVLLWFVVACSACSRREDQPQPPPPSKSTVAPADAAVDDRYDRDSLGAINFALTEGTPEARAHFTRGMLALHSFWYDEATRQFEAAIAADPSMNMAYWGAALSHVKILWGDDDVAAAKDVLRRMPDPDRMSPREQEWLFAEVALLKPDNVRTSRKDFVTAMEQLHASYPDDESATFLALALLSTVRPEDPDAVAVRKRAAGLAAGVFARNPKHPGAAHYVIHAYDTPDLAELALPHAQAYAKIAPAAFHARHMPAHIFSRLGMWKDAIASCRSAWDASVAAARDLKLSANHHDFHSLNWLVEMSFERGRRKDADAALKTFADAVRGGLDRRQRALYATQVGSYMMRTGDWNRVDELLAPLDAPVRDDAGMPSPPSPPGQRSDPASHCAPAPAASPLDLLEKHAVLDARARAAAMQHDVAKTTAAIAELDKVREQLRPFNSANQSKEAIAQTAAATARRNEALLARARGDDRALLDALRKSVADADIASDGETNPTGFVVREEMAETLLRLGQPKAAAAEFALVLKSHRGRARSLLGGARAGVRAGDAKVARVMYEQLLQVWADADDGIDGLAEARTAIAAGK